MRNLIDLKHKLPIFKVNKKTFHQGHVWQMFLPHSRKMKKSEIIYQKLIAPTENLIYDLKKLDGDILILGVGGKMGPALARLTRQGIEQAGIHKNVIGVARFSEPGLEDELSNVGIETIVADLLDDDQLAGLPQVENVLYLAGTKFGTSGQEAQTWAMNAYLPGRVAQKFKNSRIVAFSTGNVYPFTTVESGGAPENLAPEPIGEYAQSCLGRERIFQYFAAKNQTPLLIYRLNYANDVAYGVLLEIAKSVRDQRPIDLKMGSVNLIWQGDANEVALRSLLHCGLPPKILNVTGPEILSVRWLAEEFAKKLGIKPIFVNEELPTSLLSNATECTRLFGQPKVSILQMIEVILDWLLEGGKIFNKPTHFSERNGKF